MAEEEEEEQEQEEEDENKRIRPWERAHGQKKLVAWLGFQVPRNVKFL
jgi:hypothetical protein